MPSPIPRLELQDMREDLRQYLTPRVERLKYLGELFKCAAHAPGALLSFMHFTDALKEALPDPLTEVAVLSTATLMRNRYERNQHERLSIRLGYGAEWIAEVEALQPESSTLMTAEQKAVQRYVIAAVETRAQNAQQEFAGMLERLGPSQSMAIVMLVGRYITHALTVNTLELAPPVPSIFEDGFRGDGAPARNTR
ncbi:hypothetical protein ACI2S3_00255 [Ralstonia nicotianae]|uniref:Carboxymuconolactone decarboxylase family protein n=1 Tax=Ralstonia nicotianae TaxID=3037696 RepID=A0ABX8A358_9RALS|nr:MULTISPECIES: hypothetical protein [Ralstonia solanacearum species complex]MCK4124471.1 hypothetical protein [Ralstonia pseudosolanacearum]MDO3622404.1 hypothetical protein [Ralstonia pseudosolanacearum]QIK21323.1 hypothetical protein G7968_23410 [Ralstonia solanacearum]QUP61563.1 hypothetical protein GO999_24225 [Ralstonia nicotianae]